MKRNIFGRLLTAIFGGVLVCSCSTPEITASYDVIPLPQQVTLSDGDDFVLSGLDIDALRIVAEGVNKLKTQNNATIRPL